MNSGARVNVFGRSWKLLGVSIVVPGLIAGALAGLVEFAFQPSPESLGGNDFWSQLAVGLARIVASIVSISYTTGMADAAWRTGRATFADGARAFRRDGGHVFVAMIALAILGLAASLAAPLTFALSLVVYLFFCIYTMASAVVGERRGLAAVAESAEIAFARPLPTLLVVAGVVAVTFAMGIVAELLAAAPLVGPLVSQIVVQAVIAYVVLVVVGEYRLLRGLGGVVRT